MVQMNRLAPAFQGVTPWIAVVFVPVPVYVLWMHFKNYTGSPFVLLIPAVMAVTAGYFDRSRGPWATARWLTVAACVAAAVESVIDGINELNWLMVPFVLAGAVVWVALAVGFPTLVFVAIGRWIRMKWAV